MTQSLERCYVCDDPTGRAGRNEDSIYVIRQVDDEEVGPLCPDCYREWMDKGWVKKEE